MEGASTSTTTVKMPVLGRCENGESLDLNQLIGVVETKKNSQAKYFKSGCLIEEEPTVLLTNTDTGNSSPKFLKSSFPILPEEANIIENSSIPFVFEVSPVAKLHEPKIILLLDPPNECPKCQAALCKTFVGEDNTLICPFCNFKVKNFDERRLYSGTVDLMQSGTHVMPLGIVFVIETSQKTTQNGILQYMKTSFKDLLTSLERLFPDLEMALLTYSNELNFWSFNEVFTPCISVICPDQKPFLPHPNIFYSLTVFISKINLIVDAIIEYSETMDEDITNEHITFAIEVASEVIHHRGSCGKIILWHSSAEKCETSISQKQDGINIEKQYITLAERLIYTKSSIDIFLCHRNGTFMDVANKGYLCHKTGGQLYFYVNFNGNFDCARIFADTLRRLKLNTVFNCVLKVQATCGLDIKAFYGDISTASKNECRMCSMDEKKSISIEAKLSSHGSQSSSVQIKFFFTSTDGLKFVRILNYKFGVTSHAAQVFLCCNIDIVANFWGKKAIYEKFDKNFCEDDVKQSLKKTAANILSSYIKNIKTAERKMFWPPSFNFILPYIKGMLNATALFEALGVKADQQYFEMYAINGMDTVHFCKYIYPLLIPCPNVGKDESISLISIDCCDNDLKSSDAYILDNGLYQFLFVGKDVPSSFLSDVFQVATVSEIDRSIITFPDRNTNWCKKLGDLIKNLNDDGFFTKKLFVIVEGDKNEAVFRQYIPLSNGTFYRNSYESFIEEIASFMT